MNRKKIVFILINFLLIFNLKISATEISGSGATFPLPMLKIWIDKYQTVSSQKINYQGIGSANGIKSITAKVIDFGVTDIGLTQAELLQDDLIQFPLLAGGITPVIHLPGIRSNELNLSGNVIANIYLGKITFWDDSAITQLNPQLKLEHVRIKPIFRKDGSGTSFTFTNYLSKASSDWKNTLGIGSSLLWPAGEGRIGNAGVSKAVREIEGSISYVEYYYAVSNQLTTVRLENANGKFVTPSFDSFYQATQQVSWKNSSFYDSLNLLPGPDSWPIIGIFYVLIHTNNNVRDDAKQTIAFFDWIFTEGFSLAKDQSYICFTDPNLLKRIRLLWKNIKDNQGQVIYK
jgi:phosphate transport system substrate-binding protein